jgi:hypothetical protein
VCDWVFYCCFNAILFAFSFLWSSHQLAWVSAHQFLRAVPSLLAFDEVDFIRPVEIGISREVFQFDLS